MDLPEQWRPVLGFEGSYEVSDLGRVRSLDRSIERGAARRAFYRGRVLRQARTKTGNYLTVSLKAGGHSSTIKVHRLVVEAFLGRRPAGMECRHLNGDGQDNRLANLRWGTPRENGQDTLRHGAHPQANKTHCKQGHEYTAENTYVWVSPTGERSRHCRTCRSARKIQSRIAA